MYEHLDWPYPTQAETKALADRTAESFRYVQNWFARSRRSLKSKLAEAERLGCRPDEGGASFGDSRTLAKIRRGLFQVLRRHKRRVASYGDSEPSAPHATKRGIDLLSEIACREYPGDSGSGGSRSSGSGGCGGEGRVLAKDMLPFAVGRAYARKLMLRNKKECEAWRKSGQRPSDIPSNPAKTYRNDGWISYPDWLGYGSEGGAAGSGGSDAPG